MYGCVLIDERCYVASTLATSFLISFLNRSGRNRRACACKGRQHGNNTWSFIIAACQVKLLLIILYNLPIFGKILQAVHLDPNTPDSITWKLTMMDDIRQKKRPTTCNQPYRQINTYPCLLLRSSPSEPVLFFLTSIVMEISCL
jgi:hypothetical protein